MQMHLDHQICNELFAKAEKALEQGRHSLSLTQFISQIQHHFMAEEALLFPLLESVTAMQGMTQVMGAEHDKIRGLIGRLEKAVHAQDVAETVKISDQLLILMQQHNLKEENILYPMMDQHLSVETFEARLSQLLGPVRWDNLRL